MKSFLIFFVAVYPFVWALISAATAIQTGEPFAQCLLSHRMSCK